MKIAILGAGATGGYLGAKMARAGADVALIARGPHLAAMRERGLRLIEADGSEDFVVHPSCTEDWSALRDADVVFLTVKSHGLAAIAERLAGALGPETAVVTAQNGIPWWYFQRHGGPLDGVTLHSVDPDGLLSRNLKPERIIGCVVWPATRLIEPGVVEHVEGTRFTIGELDGAKSDRCQAISAALSAAGLRCPISARIRRDLWLKLLGNVAFNPISALTRATLAAIARNAETRALARAMMEEVDATARALGVEIPVSIEQRIAGAENVGEHKTSMLQDLESGRPLELEGLVGAVIELGDLVRVPVLHLRAIYACVKLLEEQARQRA